MKRFFIILSAGLAAVSCWSHSDRLKVDIDKALKKRVDARELYAEATVIPLRFSEGMTLEQESRPVMEVAADRFFLLDDENNAIRVFNWDGDYLATIDQPEKIIDISAYKDQVLDVLTAGAISEYDIKDGSFLTAYPIRDNEVILTSLARVDDDTIDLKGYLNGRAYDCGYLIGKARFYTVVNDFYPAVDYQSGRFFTVTIPPSAFAPDPVISCFTQAMISLSRGMNGTLENGLPSSPISRKPPGRFTSPSRWTGKTMCSFTTSMTGSIQSWSTTPSRSASSMPAEITVIPLPTAR